MLLPGAEDALLDTTKLLDYCLSSIHPRGKHKARVFASALGLSQDDAEWLKARLLVAAQTVDITAAEADQYGTRYVVDFDCTKGARMVRIRSAWMVRRGESVPRFLTCYVLSE